MEVFNHIMFLNAIADKTKTQKDIAVMYADMIRRIHELKTNLPFHVSTINDAIVNRWSRSGLQRIKNMAWDEIEKGE